MTTEPAPAPATDWVPVDAPAAVPRGTTPVRAPALRPLRLRRSRSQVLAALDGGGTMLQRRGRDVLVGSGLLLLPLVALNLWTTTLAFDRTGSTTLTAFGGDEVGTGVEDVAAVLVAVFASLAAAVVGCFVATIAIADRFGSRASLGDALRVLGRRSPHVVIAWVGGHWWVPFLATWALSSRSNQLVSRLSITVPLATLAATATLLVVPVMVAEGAGPWRSLRRSWRLARLRLGTALGFVISSTVIGGALLAGIAYLPVIAEQAGFVTFGNLDWLAQGIAGQLAIIVVVPLMALATAQLYVEVRLDAEGMDIALDADLAFGRRERSG